MGGLIAGLKALGVVRLAAMGGVAVAVLGLLAALGMRANEPQMAPLFGELESRDAGAVVAALDRARVPYKLSGGGSTILAPVDQIPRLRLMLAREGLPAGGAVGWEIFDRGDSLTTTPFQQDLNRLRAMEGELARSIRTIQGVRGARVHLVLPRREPFSRSQGEAQASVVLTMAGAQRLDREGVQAVLHLVATGVPGLRPANVSIVDSRGELLARGGQALSGPAGAATQDELRRVQEVRLSRAVEEMLERSLGLGRVRVETTVEMDFDRVETREERFDPENQVARSTQSTQEQNRGAEPAPTTVAGNLPGTEAATPGGASTESKTEETTNYEIGRTTRNVVRDQPVLKRVSVAVLVDGVSEPGEGGTLRWRDRTPEELARLTSLVKSAVGFNEQRGDRVEVVSMRFAAPPEGGSDAPASFMGLDFSAPMITRLAESALLALVALAAILLLGKPMVGRLTATLVPAPAGALAEGGGTAAVAGALPGSTARAEGQAALPGQSGGAAALAGAEEMISLSHVEGQLKASSIAALAEMVSKHPEESVGVMRRWLTPAEAS
jgi:flagellar M-ring protein FliF